MELPVLRRALAAILCAVAVGFVSQQRSITAAGQDKKAKPSVTVRASPTVGFSPARMVLTAELKGGADDYEDFYCASVEWDWGDLTESEESNECEPYEAGVSEVRRVFSAEHTFQSGGRYRVQLRLKRNRKVLASSSTIVTVRPGVRDGQYGALQP